MTTLAVWTPDDGLLGVVAPLALAVARRSATLVVDLDESGPRYPGDGSLADLVADGPRRPDLEPGPQRGTAVLRNGGVSANPAASVLRALAGGWPDCVVRLPARRDEAVATLLQQMRVPVVTVISGLSLDMWPDRLPPGAPAVTQAAGRSGAAWRPGPVLPKPATGCWDALLRGRVRPGDRWVRAWVPVWDYPWT
ncbi:MAG: hypothetical protein KJN71_08065 [Acidimicrobiia bacterium]|nr:hypothetical protein [Acidimicrobiia bacterium]NNC75464.1 hypothetical protein [Acidimicrobiia bacterium]